MKRLFSFRFSLFSLLQITRLSNAGTLLLTEIHAHQKHPRKPVVFKTTVYIVEIVHCNGTFCYTAIN